MSKKDAIIKVKNAIHQLQEALKDLEKKDKSANKTKPNFNIPWHNQGK